DSGSPQPAYLPNLSPPSDQGLHGRGDSGGCVNRITSFPSVLAATLIALAVLTVRSRFNDPDLWWHLRTGQIIWMNRAVPRTDLLSFTTGQHAWIAHEWLSQLSIYIAWRAGDHAGLMLWLCLATAALLVTQYVLCSLYSSNAKV